MPDDRERVATAPPRRVRVLGAPVDLVDMNEAVDSLEGHVTGPGQPAVVLAMNPEKVYRLREDSELRALFDGAALVIPDGIGIVVALRLLHGVRARRVPGADLMQRLCARCAESGRSVFLFGGSEEVNRKAADEIVRRWPGVKIAGRANGYLTETEADALAEEINSSGADVLFVGLGSPKQERWILRHRSLLNVRVCQGIGGTLDTIAETVARAPRVFRVVGLEWLYRLLREPSRARRQKALPWFGWEVVKAWWMLSVERKTSRR